MEMSDTAENESRWVVFSEELFAALLEIEGDDGRWGYTLLMRDPALMLTNISFL